MGKPTLDPTKFICEKMSELLNTEITSEVSDYMLSMESEASLEEYLRDIVTDASSPTFQQFLTEVLQCWRIHNGKDKSFSKSDSKVKGFVVNYGEEGFKLEESSKRYNNNNSNKNTNFKLKEQTFNATKQHDNNNPINNTSNNNSNNNTSNNNTNNCNKKSNKTKFKPLFGTEGQEKLAAKLPGRHECECQAQKHPLLNNCMGCGRVVCTQEGSGPCFFCGELVCSKEEQEVLDRNSNKSDKLKSYLMGKVVGKSGNGGSDNEGGNGGDGIENDPLMKALIQKDRLLDFDKNSTIRNRVIDDDCDYFSSTTWMSAKEKDGLKKKEEEMREKEYASRLGPRKFDLDFIGARLKESEKVTQSYSQLADDKEIYAANFIPSHQITNINADGGGGGGVSGGGGGGSSGGGLDNNKYCFENGNSVENGGEIGFLNGDGEVEERVNMYLKTLKRNIANPDEDLIKPLYVTEEATSKNRKNQKDNNHLHDNPDNHHQNHPDNPDIHHPNPLKSVIQDSAFQMMVDGGWCLSMHQPYASLLVAGVKRHEGRTWYTNHRGILWIASTSKQPLPEDIHNLEAFYDHIYPDKHPPFPTSYPPSCLLGRVVVTDCLAQDEYTQVHPYGESESTFVFICEDAVEMKVKLPMKGKPKIYTLIPSLHKGAKKILELG